MLQEYWESQYKESMVTCRKIINDTMTEHFQEMQQYIRARKEVGNGLFGTCG